MDRRRGRHTIPGSFKGSLPMIQTIYEAPPWWQGTGRPDSLSAKQPPLLEWGRSIAPPAPPSWGRLTLLTRYAWLIVAAALMSLSGGVAGAGILPGGYEQQVWFGRSFTSMHESASVAGLSVVSPRLEEFNQEIRKEFFVGFLSRQDDEHDYDRNLTLVGGGLRWQKRGLVASFGVGLASSKTPALSSHYQFVSGIGYQLGPVLFLAKHLSNASTSGPNRGENFFLLQWDIG